MLVQAVENRDEDEEVEKKDDDERRAAERLAVDAQEIGFDPVESGLHRFQHS